MPREVRLRAHRKLLAVRVSRIEFGHANRLSLSSQGVDTANDTLKESNITTRRTRKSKSVAVKSMELAIAVPQVVAHRVTRLALAGPKPSERDRNEFQMMVIEKQAAFVQAWNNMAIQIFAPIKRSWHPCFVSPSRHFRIRGHLRHRLRRKFKMPPLACWGRA